MKKMNDSELDALFAESAKRDEAGKRINREVMRSVRKEMMLKSLRKWAWIVGLCFGIPIIAVIYVFTLKSVELSLPMPALVACYALPLITMFTLAMKKLREITL